LADRPGEQFALDRLVELYRQEEGSLAPLLSYYEQQAQTAPGAYAPAMVLGELYRRSGRLPEAEQQFRQASAARPRLPAPFRALARLAGEQNHQDQITPHLERALNLSRGPARAEILRELREITIAQGDLGAARRYHSQLVRSSSSVFVRLELGQALAQQDRHRDALEAFGQVLPRVGGDRRAQVPVLTEMARSHIALGHDDQALEQLRRAIRLTPRNSGQRVELLELMVDVYRRRDTLRELVNLLENQGVNGFEEAELLGRLCDELAESAQAQRWYRRALSLNSRHVDTRLRLIRLYLRQGELDQAIQEYQALLRVAPQEPRFLTELAELYLRAGQRERALVLLARASRSNPTHEAIHAALLNTYSQWGEEALALEEARILARIAPRNERHLIELGERYFQGGDRQRALATWRRIPQVIPERWRGLAALGDVYADHELANDALELYQEALEIRPREISLVRRLASLHERIRSWEEALTRWHEVIELAADNDPEASREARSRIITIWAQQRRLPRQVPTLTRRFQQANPDITTGRFLYETLERLGRLPQAAAVMSRIVELRPGDVEARLALERTLVRQGRLEEAMEVAQQLLELEPRQSRELLQRLASYAMQLRQQDQALDFAARALALNPGDAQGHLRLAQLHRQQSQFGRATQQYERALELDNRLYDGYVELAELHETLGQPAQAVQVYLRLLAKAPDDALVARAGRQALLLALMDSSIAELEDDLLPLTLAFPERPVYRRVLVSLYRNLTWSLIQAVNHGSAQEAAAARQRLDAIGQRSLQPLLDALLDADPAQQEAAVSMLGHLGNPSAAVPLVAYGNGEGPPQLRAQALLAAGLVGDARVVPALIELLEGAGSPNLRDTAAFGLSRIATSQAANALAQQLDSPHPSLRALACIGLGRARLPHYNDELLERLRPNRESSQVVQAAAAWALGLLDAPQTTPQLLRLLRSGPPLVRQAAAWALGARDEPRARDVLAGALFDDQQDIRRVAAWALRRAGSGLLEPPRHEMAQRLVEGRFDATVYVHNLVRPPTGQGSALAALSQAGPQLVVALERALGGRGVMQNNRAVLALQAWQHDASTATEQRENNSTGREPGGLRFTPLVTEEEGRDPTVQTALQPLRDVATRRANALLVHSQTDLRRLAVGLLGRAAGAGDNSAKAGLRRALNDSAPSVRHLALEYIARHGGADYGAAVVELLASPRWNERVRVARTLGHLPADIAVAPLSRLLQTDPSTPVRAEAAVALTLQGERGYRALREALRHEADGAVRALACQTLASLDRSSRAAEEAICTPALSED
jgi:tetratricopeptide (TPR) repeat protein